MIGPFAPGQILTADQLNSLPATLHFPSFAAMNATLSAGSFALPRDVFVVSDETKGGGPIKYFFDASGNRYWSAMVLDT